MSYCKPKTLLSFIYNTTGVGAYRTEMHMDMRTAFERFAVTNGAVQEACFGIEKAAYDFRRFSNGVPAAVPTNAAGFQAARGAISKHADALFAALRDELVWLLANGLTPSANLSDEEVSGFGPVALSGGAVTMNTTAPYLLVDYLYYFFHFKQGRAEILGNFAGVSNAVSQINGNGSSGIAIAIALKQLGGHIDRSNPLSLAQLQQGTKTLCDTLSLEYQQRSWKKCW